MNITSGKKAGAQKVVVYGPEGIGKSTFASRFPNPLFIDTEGSTKHMDVRRFDPPSSWQMLLDEVKYAKEHPGVCKTLVIDTADWAESLCEKSVLDRYEKKGIEDFGYGKGYVYLSEEFGKLLNLLEDVIGSGINVVLTAHAKIRKFEQPDEMGAYDRWELKLSKLVMPMVKEWADMVLFANYKTIVVKEGTGDNAKAKAQGGRRVMYTAHHACWDAKNRHGLPDMLDFDFEQIRGCFVLAPPAPTPAHTPAPAGHSPDPLERLNAAIEDDRTPPSPSPPAYKEAPEEAGLPKALLDLMHANGVTEEDIRKTVHSKGYYPLETPVVRYDADFINGALVAGWDKFYELIATAKKFEVTL